MALKPKPIKIKPVTVSSLSINIKDEDDEDDAQDEMDVELDWTTDAMDPPINKLINDYYFMDLFTINHQKEDVADKDITLDEVVLKTLVATETRDPEEIAEEAKTRTKLRSCEAITTLNVRIY